ncbi:hypothetical protein HYU06_02345 [Candidatus Woesearchaeota archaeon]|nr:hypothetical protein [Candidatus Woesearchaeota archaeon]
MVEEPNMQNNENRQDNESSKNELDNGNKEDNQNKSQSEVKPQPELLPDIAEQKQPNDDINLCCRDCIRWDKYGEKCFYWWRGKRYCSRRVTSMEDLEQENLFLG